MSNQKVLEKAMQKAIDGGWKYKEFMFDYKYPNFKKTWTGNIIIAKSKDSTAVNINYIELFFNHDFAKALWADGHCRKQEDINYDDHSRHLPHYLFHLQEMVIVQDRINYLRENTK